MVHKDPDYLAKYYDKNKEKLKKLSKSRVADIYKYAKDSVKTGIIIDKRKWDMFCHKIKRCAQNKHPYSEDFTNNMMFYMMIRGCYFCGDIAMTIDRIDSAFDHTPENCIGCCQGCNNSKGTADHDTFIRKAYYRVCGEYMDDVADIWFVHKNKPRWDKYRINSDKKGIAFELTRGYFDTLTKGICSYCRRNPTTWFGIDRVKPKDGYVFDNVVTCCFDCNIDKHISDLDTTLKRNERIVERLNNGYIDIIDCSMSVIHQGFRVLSKRVCVYGKVYHNQSDASRKNCKRDNYVRWCIKNERYSDDIFEISDEFYEEYKESENITKTMFIGFDHFYTNNDV